MIGRSPQRPAGSHRSAASGLVRLLIEEKGGNDRTGVKRPARTEELREDEERNASRVTSCGVHGALVRAA